RAAAALAARRILGHETPLREETRRLRAPSQHEHADAAGREPRGEREPDGAGAGHDRGGAHRRAASPARASLHSPGRITTIATSLPSRSANSSAANSSRLSTRLPANSTITSPARRPARSAGLPARTAAIFAPRTSETPKAGTVPRYGP